MFMPHSRPGLRSLRLNAALAREVVAVDSKPMAAAAADHRANKFSLGWSCMEDPVDGNPATAAAVDHGANVFSLGWSSREDPVKVQLRGELG